MHAGFRVKGLAEFNAMSGSFSTWPNSTCKSFIVSPTSQASSVTKS